MECDLDSHLIFYLAYMLATLVFQITARSGRTLRPQTRKCTYKNLFNLLAVSGRVVNCYSLKRKNKGNIYLLRHVFILILLISQ